jgi:hypothetical protein
MEIIITILCWILCWIGFCICIAFLVWLVEPFAKEAQSEVEKWKKL